MNKLLTTLDFLCSPGFFLYKYKRIKKYKDEYNETYGYIFIGYCIFSAIPLAILSIIYGRSSGMLSLTFPLSWFFLNIFIIVYNLFITRKIINKNTFTYFSNPSRLEIPIYTGNKDKYYRDLFQYMLFMYGDGMSTTGKTKWIKLKKNEYEIEISMYSNKVRIKKNGNTEYIFIGIGRANRKKLKQIIRRNILNDENRILNFETESMIQESNKFMERELYHSEEILRKTK